MTDQEQLSAMLQKRNALLDLAKEFSEASADYTRSRIAELEEHKRIDQVRCKIARWVLHAPDRAIDALYEAVRAELKKDVAFQEWR